MMSSTFTLSPVSSHKFRATPASAFLRARASRRGSTTGFHRRPARRINNARRINHHATHAHQGLFRVFRFDVIVFCPFPPARFGYIIR